MSADEVIEWSSAGLEDWTECNWEGNVPSEINTLPMGTVITSVSTRTNFKWRFRRMPRDPMLRAMILAGLEAK